MRSPEGRYSAVFNGEIFNHRSLRKELEARGARFRGHSDTEVMLATFDAFGVAAAIPRFVGMFAIAVWDTERRGLHLVRDRLGVKTLFLSWRRGGLAFCSEARAPLS